MNLADESDKEQETTLAFLNVGVNITVPSASCQICYRLQIVDVFF
jgi:hypothetical protein